MRTLWAGIVVGLLPWFVGTDSPSPVTRLSHELEAGLKQRQLAARFQEMQDFFGDRLNHSAGSKTFSDKAGNCRLSWFDWMLRHPRESITAAEEFTRELHASASRPEQGLTDLISLAAKKLDAAPVAASPRPRTPELVSGDAALNQLATAVQQARHEFQQALSPLPPEGKKELAEQLFLQSSGSQASAPFFADRVQGRSVCNWLEKMDRPALLRSAESISVLAEPAFLRQLPALVERHLRNKEQAFVATPAGKVLLGGKGANVYRLEELPDVCAVIDLGGNDTYLEGTVSAARPVLVIIDLAGNDRYQGSQPGIQGGAVLGVSLLLDLAGDDVYQAGSVAQGAALGGIGILLDTAGKDEYWGDKRAQGSAVGGVGILIDRAGEDDYRVAELGQGVGGPLGFGLLDDLAGNDHFFAGGKYTDPYDDSPGYNGWSQGAGVGPRGTANGGIGVLLDGGGDDVYEADYFSHAGGYWFALGFARDFGGNDQRIGSTRTAYDKSPRKESRFMRYGNCFGVHYAAGYLIDDAGNDLYGGDHACVGFTWDVGVSAILDFAGNDKYEVTSSGGCACYNSGLAVLFDAGGDDAYKSPSLAEASPKSDYHAQEPRSHNFTFLLDMQGNDTYSVPLKNGAEIQRGWAGGFLIDK